MVISLSKQLPRVARVCVVGGGASGFYSAIACAEAAAARGAHLCKLASSEEVGVLVLEKSDKVLHKVSISGGGRCNVTHNPGSNASASYPRGAALIEHLAERHSAADSARWFEQKGVKLKTEKDGRVFPLSNKSESVVNCLMSTAASLGVRVQTEAHVRSLEAVSSTATDTALPSFRLLVDQGGDQQEISCDRIIFCCGSIQKRSVQNLIKASGVLLRPPAPSLFSLLLADPAASGLQGLEGLAVPDAAVRIAGDVGIPTVRGPVLVTHGGLSGPAILRLSAWGAYALHEAGYKAKLEINWAPYLSTPEEVTNAILSVPAGRPGWRPPVRRKAVGTVSPWPGELPARLWQQLLWRVTSDASSAAKIGTAAGERSASAPIPERQWNCFQHPHAAEALAHAVWPHITNFEVAVNGRRTNKEEFVTAGGADWQSSLDWDRMEAISRPGVHFAGEAVDVDGITGGFNFQGCWSTGYAAGVAASDAFFR